MRSWLSFLVLSYLLLGNSGLTVASPTAACAQAREVQCPEGSTVGEYIRCLDRKIALFQSCRTQMDRHLKIKRQALLDSIDRSANEEGLEIDEDLSQVQYHLTEMQRINRENQARFTELGKRLVEFVADFEEVLKPRIRIYGERYKEMSIEINAASSSSRPEDRVELQRLEVQLDRLAVEQSNYMAAASSRVQLVRGEIQYFTDAYRVAVQSHSQFLEARGYGNLALDPADYLQLVIRGEKNLVSASQLLRERHKELADRIRIATHTLIELYVNNKTQAIMNEARHLQSASEFLAQINAAIKKSFVDSKASQKGLALFAKKYQAMTAFIQFAAICETEIKTKDTWMTEGCSFAVQKLDAARNSIKQMPSNMKLGLNMVLAKAPNQSSRVDSIQDSLAKNDVARATVLYDQLLLEVFP